METLRLRMLPDTAVVPSKLSFQTILMRPDLLTTCRAGIND
ncbi:hypothetical protein [Arthrobacter oryzae]|nr:hypothetical protein [Arthrobacter oryzae]MDR6508982.1 hypothetical protein [Arthrobacter oryzae]